MGISGIGAVNGSEALRIFGENQEINLVLMDINMPLKSGLAALAEIKKINPSTPVIALTANAMTRDKENGMHDGFDDYLTKPIY